MPHARTQVRSGVGLTCQGVGSGAMVKPHVEADLDCVAPLHSGRFGVRGGLRLGSGVGSTCRVEGVISISLRTCIQTSGNSGYRGTSLTRKGNPLGPYRRPMPRVLRGF